MDETHRGRIAKSMPGVTASIDVLVVDPHTLVRKGICALLDTHAELRLCGEAGTFAEAVEALRRQRVDVVVADLSMSGPKPA